MGTYRQRGLPRQERAQEHHGHGRRARAELDDAEIPAFPPGAGAGHDVVGAALEDLPFPARAR